MFETEEWERLAHLEDLAQRLLVACRALREAPRHVIVDADDPDENEEGTPLDDI